MSYKINYNVPASTETGTVLQTQYVDTDSYAVTTDVAGETRLTNINSPIGLPEVLSYRASNIADIYTNSGIDRALFTPTRRGISVNIHLRQTWSATDADAPTAPSYAMPVTASITIRIPQNEFITTQNVVDLYSKALGMLYPDGKANISSLLRMALNPKG